MEFSARPIFDDINFVINDRDKIALTGKNGAGKSTLLKIVAGLLSPTDGTVSKPADYSIGYLPQQMAVADETTLVNEVRKAFSGIIELQKDIENVSGELGERDDYDSPEYTLLIERLSDLNEQLDLAGASNIDAEIEGTLTGLGFKREDFGRATEEFSGGWRMRIELAKILLLNPDLLLLDEPTNHLDIESIQWLEQFLANKAKAVLLVSHDRAFLDNVTKRTIEISCGHAYDYRVPYSRFVELRIERIEQQKRAYENQQKEIADIKSFVERFRYQATKANQVQSRIKRLEKIIPIEIDETDNSRLHLKFPPAERSGDYPLICENVGMAYGSHRVFDNVNLILKRGEKVAFVGKNGEGKSTLVKCIMGELANSGHIQTGHNVNIGYFAQNQAQLLDGDLTVFETIDNVATGAMRTRVRDILGAFMFGGEASDKKVSVLSGGEKTRLAMIKLLLEPVNFLILDEPTNHLDITTKEILKEAIMDFTGTVIVVSHDREFLDGLVDKVYEFGDGKVRENIGGIYDFLQRKRINSLSELEHKNKGAGPNGLIKSNPSPAQTSDANGADAVRTTGKDSYKRQKEDAKIINKAIKEVKRLEMEISQLEKELHDMESKLSMGEADSHLLEEYESKSKRLDTAMEEWEKNQAIVDAG